MGEEEGYLSACPHSHPHSLARANTLTHTLDEAGGLGLELSVDVRSPTLSLPLPHSHT